MKRQILLCIILITALIRELHFILLVFNVICFEININIDVGECFFTQAFHHKSQSSTIIFLTFCPKFCPKDNKQEFFLTEFSSSNLSKSEWENLIGDVARDGEESEYENLWKALSADAITRITCSRYLINHTKERKSEKVVWKVRESSEFSVKESVIKSISSKVSFYI